LVFKTKTLPTILGNFICTPKPKIYSNSTKLQITENLKEIFIEEKK